MSQSKTLWLIVRRDLHGTKYLMREGLASLDAANTFIEEFKRGQLKIHGQEYEIYSYAAEERERRIRELEIVL